MVKSAPILVTGGAGFIGSAFVRQWLTQETSPVVVLDNLTYAGSRESLDGVRDNPRLEFRLGDIADEALVVSLLHEFQPRAIVNFAAESHVDRSIEAPAPFIATNVVGTWHLLEASLNYWRLLPGELRSAFRFLHISTDEIFGPIELPNRAREDHRCAPSSPYAASKAAADQFVAAYHRTYGLPIILTYASNNYGPFQFPEKLIPLVIVNALEGKPLPIYGDGRQTRDWLYVDDHCRALCQILENAPVGEGFNVAAGQERANLDVVKKICLILDEFCPNLTHRPSSQLIKFVEDRPGHDRRYALETCKLQQTTGWRPEVEFDDGLRRTVGWYVEHLDWVKRVSSGQDRGVHAGKGR